MLFLRVYASFWDSLTPSNTDQRFCPLRASICFRRMWKLPDSCFFAFLVSVYESKFHSVSQASLKFTVQPKLALNSKQFSCLFDLANARRAGLCQSIRQRFCQELAVCCIYEKWLVLSVICVSTIWGT